MTLPEPMTGQLRVVTHPAAGGTGEAAPAGAGRERRPASDEADGGTADGPGASLADGADGAPGKAGRDGVSRPPPEVFVNGKPFAGRTISE